MTDEKKLDKHYESSPEKTLITLEQLSQTIEVMTSVVNRLRQHLSEQLEDQLERQSKAKKAHIRSGIYRKSLCGPLVPCGVTRLLRPRSGLKF